MTQHRRIILPAPTVRLWRGKPKGKTTCLPAELVACCNIRRVLVYHSPDGYEWGYGGSGPADLALNILHKCLPPHCDNAAVTRLTRGKCAELCFRLHQHFKRDFLVPMPKEGGTIAGADIDNWIGVQLDLMEEAGDFSNPEFLQRPSPATRPKSP